MNPLQSTKLGWYYADGKMGLLPHNGEKAVELFLQAGKLGYAASYYNISMRTIYKGQVGGMDEKKAKHCWELAAMGGGGCNSKAQSWLF